MAKVRQSGTMSLPAEYIAQSILFLRGQRVSLDRQLAAIYGVETRTLNQAVNATARASRRTSCSSSTRKRPSVQDHSL